MSGPVKFAPVIVNLLFDAKQAHKVDTAKTKKNNVESMAVDTVHVVSMFYPFFCFNNLFYSADVETCLRLYVVFFTSRCTLVQSAVLRSHVVCPSVHLSVTLVNCDHIDHIIFDNNFTIS